MKVNVTGVAVARRALKMTQSQLALLLGVHPITVSKWERGVLDPTAYQAALLAACELAAKRSPDVGKAIISASMSAGSARALFEVLRAAFGDLPLN